MKDFENKNLIALDFEYFGDDGERVNPVCLVWSDLKTEKTNLVWRDDLLEMKNPPFPVDD